MAHHSSARHKAPTRERAKRRRNTRHTVRRNKPRTKTRRSNVSIEPPVNQMEAPGRLRSVLKSLKLGRPHTGSGQRVSSPRNSNSRMLSQKMDRHRPLDSARLIKPSSHPGNHANIASRRRSGLAASNPVRLPDPTRIDNSARSDKAET